MDQVTDTADTTDTADATDTADTVPMDTLHQDADKQQTKAPSKALTLEPRDLNFGPRKPCPQIMDHNQVTPTTVQSEAIPLATPISTLQNSVSSKDTTDTADIVAMEMSCKEGSLDHAHDPVSPNDKQAPDLPEPHPQTRQHHHPQEQQHPATQHHPHNTPQATPTTIPLIGSSLPNHTPCSILSSLLTRTTSLDPLISLAPLKRQLYGCPSMVQRLRLERRLKEHQGCVNCINFSWGGRLLASGSDDLQVVLWDWARGNVLGKFDSGHVANVFQVGKN